MAPPKKKRTIGWHIEQKLDDAAMWHKKQIRNIRKKYSLTDYKLLWMEQLVKDLLLALFYCNARDKKHWSK